jgi:2'-5' RNA ligase
MRLFTGLPIPPHIIAPIGSALKQLRQSADLRWSPLENLHITTKFIGEWPDARLPELESTLTAMPKPGAFSVVMARFGYLPNPHHPKIFFAGVHADAGLAELAERTDKTLASLGVKPETHSYTPHLTLARVGHALGPVQALRERIAHLTVEGADFNFGAFTANEFHLYQSKTSPAGSVYSKLSTYPLEKAAS